MSKLSSYRDHITKMSLNEPRTCLARFYPDITYNWQGDIGPPPVGKCFINHSNECTKECPWHPDNPNKTKRIELTLKAGKEKYISKPIINAEKFFEEQQRKWKRWEDETFILSTKRREGGESK